MKSLIIKKNLKDIAELTLCFLNGLIGDYLYKCNSPLALKMQLYFHKRPLKLDTEHIKMRYNYNVHNKIVIFIHGLTANELSWSFGKIKYGFLLQKDLNYTPIYLRYNTGLSIFKNGELFSNIMDELIKVYPINIDKIVLIGHSLGGMIIRSSSYYADINNKKWIKKVKKIFYLGVPHNGCWLERYCNYVADYLLNCPLNFIKNLGRFLNIRSKGILNLRYGNLTNKKEECDAIEKIPLLKYIKHHNIIGTVTKNPNNFLSNLLGDFLVKKSDALIDNMSSMNQIYIKENHLSMLFSKKIYNYIKEKLDDRY